MEDPWDWDVDQVVEALCYRRSPFLGPDDFPKVFPEPYELERVFRDNSVGGLSLLVDFNNATMREDLGIKQFGHRSSLTHLIRLLRRHSLKWLAHHQAVTADNDISAQGGASNAPNEALASSLARSPSARAHAHAPYGSIAYVAALGPNLRTQSWVQGQTGQGGEMSPSRSVFGQRASNVLQEAPKLLHPEHTLDVRPAEVGQNTNTGVASLLGDETRSLRDDGEQRTEIEAMNDPSLFYETTAITLHAPDKREETFIIDDNGRKRRRLVLSPMKSDEALEAGRDPQREAIAAMPTPPREESRSYEFLSESPAAKADEPNPAVDSSDELLLPALDPDVAAEAAKLPAISEPGVVVRTDQGRKRVRPILLSQPEEVPTAESEQARLESTEPQGFEVAAGRAVLRTQKDCDTEAFKTRYERTAEHTYSGVKACLVDEMFYGTTALGETLNNEINFANPGPSVGVIDHPENFATVPKHQFGNGHRLYVNDRIKHFLHSSQHQILNRKGKTVYAVVPYPDKLVRKHQPLSMTEFKKSPEGYHASRQNRSRLAPNGRNAVSNFGHDENLFNVPELDNDATNTDAQDPDFLEKWKYLDGEDSILPLFGDSGSEGEYDLETWREMEDEQGILARPPVQSRSKSIGHDEVTAAIEQAVEKIQEDWGTQRMPKLQGKGWRLWNRCRKDGSKQHRISELDVTVTSLEARINSLRNEILGEVWPSPKQVIKQCKILQPSVFDREDAKWMLATLESKKPPEKPRNLSHKQRKIVKVIEEPLKDGEEALASDDSGAHSSEDGLEDFVVNDDDATDDAANDDIMMADVEDEELSETMDAGDLEELDQPSPTKVSAETPKLSSCRLPLRQDLRSSKEAPPNAIDREPVYIDLTQVSDQLERVEPDLKPEPATPGRIRTPPLNALRNSSDDSEHKCRGSAGFKRPKVAPEIIELESETSDGEQLPLSPSPLPSLQDYEKIFKLSGQLLEERQDRKRLLIWTLWRYKPGQRQSALDIARTYSSHDMQLHIWKALRTYKSHSWRIRGLDAAFSDSLMLIAAFFVCWTIPVRLSPKGGIKTDHLATARADDEGFAPFYHFLVECLTRFEALIDLEAASQGSEDKTPTKQRVVALKDSEQATPTKVRVKEVSQDYDTTIYATPHKKRKFVVQESQEAKALQINARLQAQEFEQRKKMLKARYQKMGLNDEDPSKVVMNPGKEEGQNFVYLNPKIGQLIQPHQKDGVQFMWRALTTNPQKLQGCLLAHTMGLGKTMQVITILVTIAEAAKSSDPTLLDQVPESLRTSQTLVLCPPSLVDNWYEEFLMWAPDPVEDNVGRIRKVTAADELHLRIKDIKAWKKEGGVLLMGFNTFRNLVGNIGNRLSEKDHEGVLHSLLEKPNLVVADEAHTAKNLKSKLNLAMNRFKSTSRIGLTGSPLANNLDEYYALIDWIAPGYLGDHVHFKARYSEPIALGFYKDSTRGDYIESRKRLTALIADLEPIVHRADISVLKGKLKGKTEFLITVPLTKLQTDLYREYVDWMLGVTRRDEPNTATLWSWLGELRLLCNHPKCYKEQLEKKLAARNGTTETSGAGKKSKKTKKQKKSSSADSDLVSSGDEAKILDVTAPGPQVSTTLMERQLAILRQMSGPLESVTLSYKMRILEQVLMLAKEANDRTLVFSHSLKTLDYVQQSLEKKGEQFLRIDGKVRTTSRQSMTKKFNTGLAKVCLISTRAGGQGLNLFGANRVVILDTHFNPIWEEQAIGRAYRLGQQKAVYVYRLTVGGTWEEALLNQSVFKQQLATRVVDKKNPMRYATKGAKQYLFQPKELEQKDLQPFLGKDPLVLDRLMDKDRE